MLEPCQTSVLDVLDRKGSFNNRKMDNKDRKINGVIEAQKSSVSPMKLKPAKGVADPIAAASVRSPHLLKSTKAVADPIAEASLRALADPIAEALARPPNPEARPLPPSPMKPKSATATADPVAEALARSPHPDSKYLGQIYSVPKLEEWPDYDDEEWLFSSNSSEPEKVKVEPSAVEETPQVWSEAQQIESADIFALPYVIPY